MKPHTVDANAIHQFQEERIAGDEGDAHQCLNIIFNGNCIALDEGGLCLQEWISCAGGKFPFALTDWVSDQIVVGKIKYFSLFPNTIRKHLISLGLPNADHKWVRLAIGSGGNIIVTNDVDFFDPSLKSASAAAKDAVKRKGTGPCSKALAKTYSVEITRIVDFV